MFLYICSVHFESSLMFQIGGARHVYNCDQEFLVGITQTLSTTGPCSDCGFAKINKAS